MENLLLKTNIDSLLTEKETYLEKPVIDFDN